MRHNAILPLLSALLTIHLMLGSSELRADPTYLLRLFNTDDRMQAFANASSTPILSNNFLGDTGFVDISPYLAAGSNTLTLRLFNDGGAYTYGYQIRRDSTIVDQGTCGVVNTSGCNTNDGATGNVFTHTVTFGLGSSATPNSLRLFNTDDKLEAFVSNSAYANQSILSSGFLQDTGTVDIGSYIRAGDNRIDLSLTNVGGGYTYGFEFGHGATIVDQGTCGTVNVVGCNANNFAVGTVFTHALLLTVPEPGSVVLLAVGLAGLGFSRRKRAS